MVAAETGDFNEFCFLIVLQKYAPGPMMSMSF